MIFVPLSKNPVAALIVPVAEKFPVVPLSVNVNRLFVSPSLIVKTLSEPAVPKVISGVGFEIVIGVAPDKVRIPDAVIFVAPLIAPVFVTPPLLLLIPPVIDAPPDETVNNPPIVCAVVKLLFCPL